MIQWKELKITYVWGIEDLCEKGWQAIHLDFDGKFE